MLSILILTSRHLPKSILGTLDVPNRHAFIAAIKYFNSRL
eukprot:UN00312